MHPVWQPDAARVRQSQLTRLTSAIARTHNLSFASYGELHRWSVEHPAEFWQALWRHAGVEGTEGRLPVLALDNMPAARFFPEGRLSFTANLLREPGAAVAIVATTESGRHRQLSFGELRRDVGHVAAALRAAGVRPGDRVAGIVPNTPEAVIAALGTAAIGAIWSSCSPDFGADGIVDRFGQIGPKILIAVDGYAYGGRYFDCLPTLAEVRRRLPTLVHTVVIAYGEVPALESSDGISGWDAWLATGESLGTAEPASFAFNHPVYILYSSGTTGPPKAIVHGAGGTLLQHLKEHQAHCDVRRGDRVLYFTTTGWMMWHWLVSALATGAAIVLYDGSPVHPHPGRLFDLADEAAVTLFGTSARYLDAIHKAGLEPRRSHDLGTVRTITSTGSPLGPETFDFIYASIKEDVHLASISGGSDIVGCFVLGNPNGPVWRGEIQAAGLGMDVRVFDDHGRPAATDEPGELVCATPFPSMPLGFWNDPGDVRYRATYFERFSGVWCHGDWIRSTPHGGFVISGRSDATLKPGGVRIGTAEIYRQVQQIPEVVESLAVGQRWQGDERIVLFVRLAEGRTLDEAVRRAIATRLRTHASPRHVPARIIQVTDIPRTRSGKLVELAVQRVIHGEPVANRAALANPEALDLFRDLPELRS
jgi:acetoacetyl-CoA synthetase